MIERIDNSTPIEIQNWLMFPYEYFSKLFENFDLTLLDIGCGNNFQYEILKSRFQKVISMDFSTKGENIQFGDILNIPLPDKSVDMTFSFETIEHVDDHIRVWSELKRVTKHMIIIGSVNKTGPNFINNIEIFKGEKQPFHKKELSADQWRNFFGEGIYFQSILRDGEWRMALGLNNDGYSNFFIDIL